MMEDHEHRADLYDDDVSEPCEGCKALADADRAEATRLKLAKERAEFKRARIERIHLLQEVAAEGGYADDIGTMLPALIVADAIERLTEVTDSIDDQLRAIARDIEYISNHLPGDR